MKLQVLKGSTIYLDENSNNQIIFQPTNFNLFCWSKSRCHNYACCAYFAVI